MESHQRGIRGGLLGIAFAATGMLACSGLNAPLYFKGEAFEAQGNDDPLPTSGLTLRFRQPTMQEQMQLDAERDARGYDMDIPWVSRDKVHVEVSYKVTNLSDQTSSFTLMVDGADQYTKYDTQVVSAALQQGADDPPVFLPLIALVPQTLAPGASYSGVVREDDFAEGELDLDALGRWNNADTADPTFAGVLINRSDVDAIGLAMVPGGTSLIPNTSRHRLNSPGLLVVPAMIEVDLRLKTDVHMSVEYFVRVRDDEDRLWHDDADRMLDFTPTLFQPPAMM
jgi:hypothetical protein